MGHGSQRPHLDGGARRRDPRSRIGPHRPRRRLLRAPDADQRCRERRPAAVPGSTGHRVYVKSLRDIAILDAGDVTRLGAYMALIDALEAAHREPPAAVERIVYGPEGRAEKLLALPAWQ